MKTNTIFVLKRSVFQCAVGLAFAAAGMFGGRLLAQSDTGLLHQQERKAQRAQEFLFDHSDSTGTPRPDLWLKGIQDTKRMQVADKITISSSLAPGAVKVVGVGWAQTGPAPLRIDGEQIYQGAGPDGGEVTSIAIDPRNATDQTIYIALNDGGIWKSTDGGTSWKPKTDFMPSLSMGAVALDPSNPSIVYAGTGNPFDGACQIFKGIGIYRSTDGGDTWTVRNPSGVFTSVGINRIVVLPSGALLVATSAGRNCGGVLAAGLFRSVDGGLNFGNNSPTFNNGLPVLNGDITDLDVDTTAGNTVYASVRSQGVVQSTDDGVTFPTALFSAANLTGLTTPSLNFIVFSQSTQPNSQTMYVLVQTPSTCTSDAMGNILPTAICAQLYRSINSGGNWTLMPDASNRARENNGCQCGYDQTLGVDPQDANRVYIGFQELYLSTDGGANFGTPAISQNQIHWDHHYLTFSPQSHWGPAPTRIYVGTDGGVHTSGNGGAAWANINEGIAANLFISIDVGRGSAANNGWTYGGTQDTGVIEHNPLLHAGNDWHLSRDGDGGFMAVDPLNPAHAISTDNGRLVMTTDGGASWPLDGHGFTSAGGLGFVYYDPSGNNAYVGLNGTQLWQSTDNGGNFASIHTFPQNITRMAMAKIDRNTMWVGLADGTVQRTTNLLAGAASTWTAHTVTGAPARAVTGIAVDPENTDEVVVVYGGFFGNNPGNLRTTHVFRSTNNGVNWTDISGTDGGNPAQNLPDLPVHAVVIDPATSPHTIIVGNDAAVLRTSDLGATWQVLGAGFPTVDANSLALDTDPTPALLRVGTYGRSTFQLVVTNLPRITIPGDVFFDDTCVGETNYATLNVCNTDNADLEVGPISSTNSQFAVITPSSGYPVVISPDFCFPFRVRFTPTSTGDKETTFVIPSNDPFSPTNTARGFGKGVAPRMTAFMANSSSFGDVCIGSFLDQNLTINNSGGCTLIVSNITSTSSQFLVPVVVNYPIVIHPGDSVQVPIRFQPTSLGAKTGTIMITSNDPLSPKLVSVSGNAPPGDVRVTGSTDFGKVCAGALAEKTISVCNVGKCNLTVTNVSLDSNCTNFTLINNPFPALVSPDSCEDVVIRFTPHTCGTQTCVLTIVTDDPDTPVINLVVTANTPCASIDVPPDLAFPPTVITNFGSCKSVEPFPISNTGFCPLVITDISIGGVEAGDYSFIGLPSFPIILEPGHIVGEGDLLIAFAPGAMDRDREATVTVTYLIDPVAATTAQITRKLCGEGVNTGGRVLVTQNGIPLAEVEKIQLLRINANRNRPPLDTVDVFRDAPLVTVVPNLPCPPFQYHREYGTVSNPIQLLAGSYQVTVTAIINGKRKSKTVGFDVSTCDFNPTIVVNF